MAGKVAVITGGARGIGAATAKAFARNGAHVVIADILDDLGAMLAASISGHYVHCDVSKESDVESAVEHAVAWKGRLDIMFNNAGIAGQGGSVTTTDMDDVRRVLAVNVLGVLHGIKHAACAMKKGRVQGGGGGWGSIICTSSSAAIMGGLGSHAYTLSKEAVNGLVRSAACELGEHGIRVNSLSPHGVPSEMLVNAYREYLGNQDVGPHEVSRTVAEKGSLLRGRGGTAEDVAEAAVFLASDRESGFLTAHNLVVDGGYTSATPSMSFIYR